MKSLSLYAFLFLFLFAAGCNTVKIPQAGESLVSDMPVKDGPSEKLAVLFASPSGTTTSADDVKTITVGFNQPMAAFEKIGEPLRQGPLKITPAIDGTYSWQGTTVLVFTPSQPIPRGISVKVEIPAETKSLSGETLEAAYAWSFETLRPQLLKSLPDTGAKFVSKNGPFLLLFNMKLDPVGIAEFLALEEVSGGKKVEVSVRPAESKDPVPDGWNREHVIAVVPETPLSLSTQYRLVARAGLTDDRQKLGLISEQAVLFTTQNVFAVNAFPAGGVKPESGVEFIFTNPVEMKELAANVTFNPPVELASYYKSSDYKSEKQSFYVKLKAATEYTVTVGSAMKDVNGDALGKDAVLKLKTLNYASSLSLAEGSGVIEAALRRQYPVFGMNVDSVRLEMTGLTKQQLIPLYDIYGNLDENKVEAASYRIDRTWDIKTPLNQGAYVPLGLSEVLSSTGKGLALIRMDQAKFRGTVDTKTSYFGQIQVTNMGITCKSSPENILIWVTSLDQAKPVAGAEVEIRGRDNKVYWKGKTDKNGIADAKGWLELGLPRENRWTEPVIWIFAEKGDDFAFINTSYQWSVYPWLFDIPYDYAAAGSGRDYSASLFTDKGLYSPGDTVRLKGLCRERTRSVWKIPSPQSQFQLRIYDSRGNTFLEKKVNLSSQGGFDLDIPVSESAATGAYYADFSLLYGDEDPHFIASAGFQVEVYRPADYSVDVESLKQEYVAGETFSGKVDGKWMIGTPMSGSDASWKITLEPAFFTPKGMEGYAFGPEGVYDESGVLTQPENISLAGGKGTLDETGKLAFTAELKNAAVRTTSSILVEGSVKGAANAEISDSKEYIMHKGAYYIGVKNGSFAVPSGKAQNISLVTVSPEGEPVTLKKLDVKILSREWNSVQRDAMDGGRTWISEKKDREVQSFVVVSSDKPSEIAYTPTKPGYYVVSASGADSSGNVIVTESGFYAYGSGYVSWQRGDDDTIELVRDKNAYKPGEPVRIIVKSPYEKATALVTFERENVLERKIVELHGSADTIEFTARENDAPNIFVSAVLIQGRVAAEKTVQREDLGKPSFKIGYVDIPIVSKKKKLALSVKPSAEQYEPGQEVSLELTLTDSAGKAVEGEVCIAVVDKGVLSLTDYHFPDVYSVFYSQRPLAVTTSESRGHLIGQRDYGEKGRDESGGGGMAEQSRELSAARKNFRDNAYWNPAQMTDKSGRAKVSFKLPDNLTTFRIMAVAQSGEYFSSAAEREFVVAKPLSLKSAMPLFANRKDRFQGGVTAFNSTGKSEKAVVKRTVKGLKPSDSITEKSAVVPAGGEKEIVFSFEAETPGEAEVVFSASMGGHSDELLCVIPVRESETSGETVAVGGILEKERLVQQLHIPGGVEGVRLSLSLSGTVVSQLQLPLLELLNRPYDSLEYRASGVFPALYGPELLEQSGASARISQKDYDGQIKRFLSELALYQRDGGGFSSWKSGSSESEYLSCYVMHAAHIAGRRGFEPDGAVKEKAIGYLESLLSRPADKPWSAAYSASERYMIKSYALYVLSLFGYRDAPAWISRLSDKSSQMGIFGQAMLMKSMKLAGRDTDAVAAQMRNKLRTGVESSFFDDDFGPMAAVLYDSSVRSNAAALQAFTETGRPLPGVAKWLMDSQRQGSWGSSQENAFAVYALGTYFEMVEAKKGPVSAQIGFAGEIVLESDFTGEKTVVKTLEPDLSILSDPVSLILEKTGAAPVYYSARMSYVPTEKVPARDRGLAVFKKIDPVEGRISDSNFLNAGTVYKVTLSVVSPADRNYVVLNDPVPAGFSVVNTSFATESSSLKNKLQELQRKQLWDSPGNTFDHWEIQSGKILLFADRLSKGEHLYTYFIRAQYPGDYVLYPTRASLMYEDDVFGTTNSRFVRIK